MFNKVIVILSAIFTFFVFSSVSFASQILFSDDFNDSNGVLLSQHNSRWVPFNVDSYRSGEYEIKNSHLDSGSNFPDQIFDSNKLLVTLPEHFTIVQSFFISPSIIFNDSNRAFMDIKLENLDDSSSYLFRFFPKPPAGGITLSALERVNYSTNLGVFNDSGLNTVEIEYNDGLIGTKINGQLVLSFFDNRLVPNHLVFHQHINTAISDRIIVVDGSLIASTPTPIPTPTPFPITHFSQRDQAWKNQEYDKASQWSPNKISFEYWGCAVTAASTVLDYYGIHQLPNSRPNNPGELNAWLKSQPDGFLRYGALNWNAVSRASRLASLGNSSLPALEYKYKTSDQLSLYAQLSLKQPVILEVPGHFVTAYQYRQDDNIVDIVDPYWTTTRTTLASYNNTYISKRSFVPSHTDLSYILSTTDTDISSKLFRKENNVWIEMTDASNYTQNPIANQEESLLTSAKPFNVLEYPKPPEGEYELRLHKNSPGQGEAQIYIYDLEGNPVITPTSTYFGGLDLKYSLIVSKSGEVNIKKKVDFDSLIDDVVSGRISGVYKRKYNAQDLVILLNAAKSQYSRSKKGAKMLLESCKQIVTSRSYYITPDFYNFLLSQISLAETNLF